MILMRFLGTFCLVALTIADASGAAAQGPLPGTAPADDKGKRFACAADVTAKKLRGTDRLDAMQICMAEGRLDCVKRAVAQKVPPSSRKVFLQGCMQGPASYSDKIRQ